MNYYTQNDYEQNKREKKRSVCLIVCIALPFLALAAAAFVLRAEALCMAACVLGGSAVVLTTDFFLMPAVRYGRHLQEIKAGSFHRTLGTLVRVSGDFCHENGLNFREVTLNVYEDLSEEGERRFLLLGGKELCPEWMNRDVVVTSYGNVILACEVYETAGQEENE